MKIKSKWPLRKHVCVRVILEIDKAPTSVGEEGGGGCGATMMCRMYHTQ